MQNLKQKGSVFGNIVETDIATDLYMSTYTDIIGLPKSQTTI